MVRRFEVVSAPVEQRLQEGLQDQALIAIDAARGVLNAFEGKRAVLSDKAFVASMTASGIKLLMPSSLPGFLLFLSLFLRLGHWAALRFTASRAVAKHKSLLSEEGNGKAKEQ